MKALLLINPNSGPKSIRKEIDQAEKLLIENGYEIKKIISRSSNEARNAVQKAILQNFDLIIVAGGDGTINTVSNVLANTNICLAIIPTGTANVLANELKIPTRKLFKSNYIHNATKLIIENKQKVIDLGKVSFKNGESKYFVMWCGIGLDAMLTGAKKIPPEKRAGRIFNYLKWVFDIFKISLKFSGSKISYKIDNKSHSENALQLLISNGSIYANYFKTSDDAKIDDSVLEYMIIKNRNKLSLAFLIIKSIFSKKLYSDLNGKLKSIYIDSQVPLPIHVDAEKYGNTPIKIEIIPKSLGVIVAEN